MHALDITDSVVHTMSDNINRFKRYGKILVRTATRGSEKAKIGQLGEDTFIVFYPDGTYDRFESGPASVEYRPGWTGPDLTQKGKTIESLEEELKAVEKVIEIEDSAAKKKPAPRRKKTVSPGWAATLEMMMETQASKEAEEPVKKPRKTAAKKTSSRKGKTVH